VEELDEGRQRKDEVEEDRGRDRNSAGATDRRQTRLVAAGIVRWQSTNLNVSQTIRFQAFDEMWN